MNLPLYPYEIISQSANLLLALVIGVAFGFILERGGLGNARKLVGQFLLKDLTVFKVMFSAILTAMLGLYLLAQLGLFNLDLVAFPDSYWLPQVTAGLLLGAGFAIAGYCPGTTLVGMATGKRDALYCFAGLFLGSWLFSLVFDWIALFYQSGHLAEDHLSQVLNVQSQLIIFAIVVIAIIAFWLAEKIEVAHE